MAVVSMNQGKDDAIETTIIQKESSSLLSNEEVKEQQAKLAWNVIFVFSLQVGNILAWYYTNGMNGISMQSYALQVNQKADANSSYLRFMTILTLNSIVTFLQLFLGGILGRVLLLGLNQKITWQDIAATHWTPLSSLHALGSVATNLGFMYGKASLVQVIKLLEPFETLLLSQLLFREAKFTVGVVSAMMTVVGAAISLLNLQSSTIHPLSAISAIISGIALSTRNVLQRKHHHDNTAVAAKSWTKLEKSIIQFTQLSFFSSVPIGAMTIFLLLVVHPKFIQPDIQVLLWHPLYNVFSMITLGFCSALTHSLLNAGKRVFAICMAIIWFREGLNPQTLAGLFMVGIGGSWYTIESKKAKSNVPAGGHSTSTTVFGKESQWYKLPAAISGLVVLLLFQNYFTEH